MAVPITTPGGRPDDRSGRGLGLGRPEPRKVLRQLGETEVQDLHVAVRAQHDVFRLDVAVDDAGGVGGDERAGDLRRHVERFAHAEGGARQPLAQRLALDVFGDDELRAVHLPDLVDGEDVRMIEGRGGARLLPEALYLVFVMREVFGQELQGDAAAEACVFG